MINQKSHNSNQFYFCVSGQSVCDVKSVDLIFNFQALTIKIENWTSTWLQKCCRLSR